MPKRIIFSAFLLIGWLLAIHACSGDDDDEDSAGDDDTVDDDTEGDNDDDLLDDDDSADPECAGNTPPDLLSLRYRVNGQYAEPPVSLTTQDNLEFEIEYADVDCNLNGGTVAINMSAPDGSETIVLEKIAAADCSSEAAGEPLRFFVDPTELHYILAEADQAVVVLNDACFDESDSVPLNLDIELEDPDCTANHAPELLDLSVLVNGEPIELPGSVSEDDAVVLRVEYADEDCNLNMGEYLIKGDGDTYFHSGEETLLGIGCSSAADGAYDIEFDPEILEYIAMGITENLYLILRDVCLETSAPRRIDLTLE